MLSMIDRYWREHLYEMDYLQEGINLRAMGQKDPLTEWQREGFDMFEAMMGLIQDDFVRYVFHLEVATEPAPQQQPRNLTYLAPEDPVTGAASMRGGGHRRGRRPAGRGARDAVPAPARVGTPVRRRRSGPGPDPRAPARWPRPSPSSSGRSRSTRCRAATTRASAAAARSTSSATAGRASGTAEGACATSPRTWPSCADG